MKDNKFFARCKGAGQRLPIKCILANGRYGRWLHNVEAALRPSP